VWKGHRSTDKRYAGDNRLIIPESPYRRNCLAPRHWGGVVVMRHFRIWLYAGISVLEGVKYPMPPRF